METNTDGGNDEADGESKEKLLQKISDLQLQLTGRDDIIDALKLDLGREKKLNDILMDQIVLLKTDKRKGLPFNISDLSSDSSDDESLIQAAQEQKKTPHESGKSDDDEKSVHSSSSSSSSSSSPSSNGPPNTKNDGKPDKSDKPKKSLAKLHVRDTNTSKKLSYILNSLKNLPKNRTTLLIGDSNFHYINGELDPVSKSTAVRAVSGLCVVAAADALKSYQYRYTQFKKIVWSLGANDFLHRQDHCDDDWDVHLSTLLNESKRIFKGATVNFILPFRGLPKIPYAHMKYMEQTIQEIDPSVKRHLTPSLRGKVRADGVHINKAGISVLRRFLVARFTNYRPTQQPLVNPSSGRVGNLRNNSDAYPVVRGSERVTDPRNMEPPPSQSAMHHRAWGQPTDANIEPAPVRANGPHNRGWRQREDFDSQYPPLHDVCPATDTSQEMASRQQRDPLRDLSEALASLMYSHLHRRI